MKRLGDFKFFIAFVLIIAVALFANLEREKVVDTNWKEEFVLDSKSPKSLYVFLNLLKDIYGEKNVFLEPDFSKYSIGDTSEIVYLAINDRLNYEKSEADSLEKLARNGCNVILIGNRINFKSDEAYISCYMEDNSKDEFRLGKQDSFILFKYKHHNLDFKDTAKYYITNHSIYEGNLYNDDDDDDDDDENEEVDENGGTVMLEDSIQADEEADTTIVDEEVVDSDSIRDDSLIFDEDDEEYIYDESEGASAGNKLKADIKEIMTVDSAVIFSYLPIGKGKLVAHTAPDLFTNNASLQPFYLDHFAALIDIIGNEKKIVITRPQKVQEKEESPFEIILKNKYLATAYYLLLFTMLLYFLFALKRKQNPIPIIQPKSNTSLEYVDTLAKLYQLQNQPFKLVGKLEENFYSFVANSLFVYRNDPEFESVLSKKLKIEIKSIQDITTAFQRIKRENFCDDELLIELYRNIQQLKKISYDR